MFRIAQNVSPQESFSTSLGIDPSIRIAYPPLVKRRKDHSPNIGNLLAFQAKTDVTTHTQRVSIKNTRNTKISPLILRDNVPLSEDASIKVLVHVPKELGESKGRREVNVAAGIKARWALKEDPGNEFGTTTAGGVEDDGVVEWVCEVDTGKTVDLALVWDVIAPAGLAWSQN